MKTSNEADFNRNYQTHLKHLKLKVYNHRRLTPTPAPSAASVHISTIGSTICPKHS
uniref:Uncharacterized protein n=2 Tax=Candidatus Kentrum sp. MB TaxID=2138164 RepID=A0A451BFR2_9GAMM|nr:MAG: hypothetical protein BECKMB1821G_GA0114241_105912 [Candidatus Kentron sp. MB]VFK77102.1 MAG: hypothetical protein BECKMB1821H_GA0114242_11001 [Candidatus Kentron sp. MB]